MASAKKNTSLSRRPNRPPAARRVRKFTVHFPLSRDLTIALRKFKTSKARRSKKQRQFVLQVDLLTFREIAIAYSRAPRRRKKAISAGSFNRFAWPRPRTALPIALIAAGIVSSIIFGLQLQKPASFNIAPSHAKKVLAAPAVTAKVMPKSIPARLRIPKIGVDTGLSQVGLQSDGSMEMPWDIGTAAWYKYSPTPGEIGPSVIVGHLDGANFANMAGIFYRLRELAPGDEFSVTRSDGTVAVFKVLSLKQVPQNNFPTQEIYGNINYAGIRLITCGGSFDQAAGHYTDNTVVFAALE
jgi:sortase (surface protein transpeptidase)